jgi:tyrosinase
VAFRNILESQRSSLYTLFATEQSINSVISTRGCGSPRYGSFEGIHGPVHTLHYPGHMAPAGATAFDPLFWLHHSYVQCPFVRSIIDFLSNVDRQIAIWQSLWPDNWLSDCFAETPTWTIDLTQDNILNSTSPLTPFHKNAAGTFYNSDNVRNIRNLGYTYPELANSPSHSTLIATVNKLYGGSATVPVTTTSRVASTEKASTRYFVQVDLPAYGLDDGEDGSLAYNVLVFAGDVDSNAKAWAASESLIGMASTLGGVGMRYDLTITSLIDVTSSVESGLETDEAVKHLKNNLSYRIEIVSSHLRT